MIRDAVQAAVGRSDVRDAVAGVYRGLQEQIDLRKPKCETSGRCCRFDEFGHRLYVTTMELAAFVAGLAETRTGESKSVSAAAGSCPFQIDGLCSVHSIRPFGCRVFFCDSTSDLWQHEQYELFHARLKQLHEALSVPYFYVEWRHALRELGLASVVEPPNDAKRLSLRQLPL